MPKRSDTGKGRKRLRRRLEILRRQPAFWLVSAYYISTNETIPRPRVHLGKVLTLFTRINDRREIANTLLNIGVLNQRLKQYDDAVSYFEDR